MLEMLKIFSVQKYATPIGDIVAKKVQFSKDFRTDGAHFSKLYNHFYKKFA